MPKPRFETKKMKSSKTPETRPAEKIRKWDSIFHTVVTIWKRLKELRFCASFSEAIRRNGQRKGKLLILGEAVELTNREKPLV